ncbi:MAG: hypothetical protein ACRERC_18520 [Candidatus Binatia bacterium]
MGSISRPRLLRLILAAAAAVLLPSAAARADVDVNGPWRVLAETAPYFNPDLTCIVDVVQTGSAITVTGNACAVPIALSGTIDPMSGAISVSGPSDPLLCPTLVIVATATLASDAFSGTFSCNGIIPVSGPFTAGLCANGALDAGEDCDDGNLGANDCCSASCGFEPSTFSCFADGTVCTIDHCDGAGSCVPQNGPAGVQCENNGNSCNDSVCNASGVCTHPNVPAGTVCFADFNGCTDDLCDGAGSCQISNNSAACNDWNSCTVGDTCAAGACVPGTGFAPAGIACDTDLDLCTIDQCDGVGGCQNVECSLCCGGPGCQEQIGTCAHPVLPVATLQLRHRDADAEKDKLLFKWRSGAATAVADFGDPTGATKYELCIFDSGLPQAHLQFQASAPAGGTCDGKPCWRAKGSSGFAYKDKGLAPGGLERIRLKAGGDGEAQILVKGRGENLQLVSPYFYDEPLFVQLRASNGKCWQADFATALRPNASLKAKNGQ